MILDLNEIKLLKINEGTIKKTSWLNISYETKKLKVEESMKISKRWWTMNEIKSWSYTVSMSWYIYMHI